MTPGTKTGKGSDTLCYTLVRVGPEEIEMETRGLNGAGADHPRWVSLAVGTLIPVA